jgi:hypothetical protein
MVGTAVAREIAQETGLAVDADALVAARSLARVWETLRLPKESGGTMPA